MWFVLFDNWMRQISYYISYKKYHTFDFCESTETKWFAKRKMWWIGYIEEVSWFLLWSLFWIMGIRFFMYGWIFDAFQDVAIASFWPKIRVPNIEFKGTNIFREIVIPYLFVGPLLDCLNFPIVSLSFIIFIMQVIMISFVPIRIKVLKYHKLKK